MTTMVLQHLDQDMTTEMAHATNPFWDDVLSLTAMCFHGGGGVPPSLHCTRCLTLTPTPKPPLPSSLGLPAACAAASALFLLFVLGPSPAAKATRL